MPSEIEISAELLRALHRIHTQRAELQSQLDRGPRQIKAGEGLIAKAAGDLAAVKEKLKQSTLVADEKQLQLKGREDRIKDLEAKLNTAASNREFSTLKEQIAADEQANSVLSDEILEVLEEMETIEVEIEAAEAELKKQQEEQEGRVKEVTERLETVSGNLDYVNGQLEEAEKQIPAAAKADYKRLIGAKGEEALAPVESDSCGGCNQTLTTQHVDRLRMSVLIRCPNCDAFLYLPEASRPGA